jgi:putative pyruvate formate lyase activating enzyme
MRYHDLYRSGELLERIRSAYVRLRRCDICPRNCGVDRVAGETGACRAGSHPKVASAAVHHGEEPPISGTGGSGTIFFSGCSLKCLFCQNFPISQHDNGEHLTTAGLADRMLRLQRSGVHNINFVTPTHYLPQILASLYLAIGKGFNLPLVWNSSGYEKTDVLSLLNGIVDIYLPDMKYHDEASARALSSAHGYTDVNRAAVRAMLGQVGHLEVDVDGIARQGLIIRHLVLPQGQAGSTYLLPWIAANLGTETAISLMRQYFPAHLAAAMPVIGRKITDDEYAEAVNALESAGLENGWIQD